MHDPDVEIYRKNNIFRDLACSSVKVKQILGDTTNLRVGRSNRSGRAIYFQSFQMVREVLPRRRVTSKYGGAFPLSRKRDALFKLSFGFDVVGVLGGPFVQSEHGAYPRLGPVEIAARAKQTERADLMSPSNINKVSGVFNWAVKEEREGWKSSLSPAGFTARSRRRVWRAGGRLIERL